MTEWQLRDYRIAEGHLAEFLAAWTAGVLPLRQRAGFRIQAWTVPAESRFVWILARDGPGTFAEADAAYYASPERDALDPDPAQWIVEERTNMLAPVAGQTSPPEPGAA